MAGITLNELAYSLFEDIRGSIKDSDDIDIREFYFAIHTQRALWIDKTSITERDLASLEQNLGCLQLERVDSGSYCKNPAIETGYTLMRTVKDIPKPIIKNGAFLITRVGGIDQHQVNFSFVSINKARFSGNGKFNKNGIFSYYMDNKIFIKSKDPLSHAIEYINVRGVFENPEDLGGFICCNNDPCYSPNSPYPIPAKLIDYMLGEIRKNKLQFIQNLPSDRANDSNFNLTANSK